MTTLTLEDYVFGFARTASQKVRRGQMRFTPEGQPKENGTIVDRLVGQWMVDHADRDGNVHAEVAMDVQTVEGMHVAYLYHPDIEKVEIPEDLTEFCGLPDAGDNHDNCHIATTSPYPQGRDSHWRMCYAREIATRTQTEPCWRLRDERTGELWFVQGYQGPMNVNWFDQGSHIFADGPVYVDDKLVAHFGESG